MLYRLALLMRTAEVASDKERTFLEALRDDYYVNSTLTYAAHKAGLSLGEAIDIMRKYGLPQAADNDNKEAIREVGRLLRDYPTL